MLERLFLKSDKVLRNFILIFLIIAFLTEISYIAGDILTKTIPHQDYLHASQSEVARLVDDYWDQPYGLYLEEDVSPISDKGNTYSQSELKKLPAQTLVYWQQPAGRSGTSYTKETLAQLLSDVQYDHANDGFLFSHYPYIPIMKIIGTPITGFLGIVLLASLVSLYSQRRKK